MATRGTRTTSITFGTFEMQVSLSKAKTSRDLKTEYVNEAGQKVTMSGSSGGSRTPAPGIEKAVRVTDSHVIRLPKDELDAIEQESKEQWGSMRVLEVIDYRQVPTERIEGSYWLQPAQGSAQGLYLLHRALRDEGAVAVVKWLSTSREKLGVIRARTVDGKRALLLSELVFRNDFADPDEDALAINTAAEILGRDPAVHDRAVSAAVDLVRAFRRAPGGVHQIDAASDGAVDARLALLERLQAKALTGALEASTAPAEGLLGDVSDGHGDAAQPTVIAIAGGRRAA